MRPFSKRSRPARRSPVAGLWLWWIGAIAATTGSALAEETSDTSGSVRVTSARLDFTINIDRMLYLRVGAGGSHSGGPSGTGPAANATVSLVSLALGPMTIPGTPTVATNGSNQPVAWNVTTPTYSAASSVTLPVEVRSNAGQVSIGALVSAPLTNGTEVIPMSIIGIASDDNANLPAPAVPDVGTGASVNVATGGVGTAAAPGLLTYRTANWTFSYNPATAPLPGHYTGQITFVATVP